MDCEFFKVEKDGAVAHLIMNRPDKLNAMNKAFWAELPRLIRALEEDGATRAMVLSGEGRHFTAGMDLAAFADVAAAGEEPARDAYKFRRELLKLQGSFTALEEAPFPTIMAIHGACIGGGIDMITAADIRLASADAYFRVEEINIGMTADVGTLQRLPKLISFGLAMELSLTGRRFDAEEAKGFGLINHVHADRDATVAAAMEMAHEIAAKSPLAITGVKRSLHYARDHTVAEGLEQIASWNAGMLKAEDLMRAIQARAAKQDAEFRDLPKQGGFAG